MTLKTLTIGGSDTWGGGGVQTDLRTFENLDVFGLSVLTCLAVEEADDFVIRSLPSTLVAEQLKTIENNFELNGVKIGLLADLETVDLIRHFCQRNQGKFPIILDPVMAFKETKEALQQEYIQKIKQLFPYIDLVTPNRREAQLLSGMDTLETTEELNLATQKIAADSGVKVIITGGAKSGIDTYREGALTHSFTGPLSNKKTDHGAGCSFSSAICAHLAHGLTWFESIERSKQYVYQSIENGVVVGEAGNVWRPKTERSII